MRLSALAASAALLTAACANIGSPPGGPERLVPPALVRVSPDSGAVNVRARNVTFEFDVVVNDRSGGAGGVEGLFLVSPSDGFPRVRWRRNRIEVRPRRGFRPNTAYAVTMLPGISDLRGNVLTTPVTVVFSTGPRIPPYAVMGRVFDWINERPAPLAQIEVIRLPDSLRYVGAADSTGQFTVGPLEEGSYVVRAVVDNNRNRGIDRGEPWDSLPVTIRGTSPFLELLAAPRDSAAPRLLTVTATDSVTIQASFDQLLDPAVPLTPASFRLVDADSNRVTIVRAMTRAQADAERLARDTTARDTTARQPVAPGRQAPARPGAQPTRPAGTDPATTARLRPSRPAPVRDVVVRIDSVAPLRPGATYRLTALSMRSLTGATRSSDRTFTVPLPAARDSARVVRPPAAAPPATGRP